VPRLCKFYPGICLTTEGEARKNLRQGSRRVLVYILPKRTHYETHIHKPTHYKIQTYTHPHITKQFKTNIVQVKTNTEQDIPKLYSHNIIKPTQYKVNDTFIYKNITVTHFTSLYPPDLHHNSLHFTNPFTSLLTSLHFTRCH